MEKEEFRREKRREYDRRYRDKHRVSINKRQREYYKKTEGKCYKQHYKKNKDKWFANTNRYRNTIKGKAYVKSYNARPEVKIRNKKWFAVHPHYSRDWAREHKKNGNKRN